MSLTILGRDTVTGQLVELPITGGKVDVNATVSVPEGGATSAKQDEQTVYLDAIEGKLPALGQALAAASIPVVLPAAQITSLALDSTLTTFSAKTPSAAALANNMANPTTHLVGACLMGREENQDQFRRIACNGSQWLHTVSNQPTATVISRSTAYEKQRTLANFSCAIWEFHVYLKSTSAAGWIMLVHKGSAATGGESPYGGHVYPIAPGTHVGFEFRIPEVFASGCQVVFSTTEDTVTLSGSDVVRITVRGA